MPDILLLQLGRLGDLVQTLPLIRRLKADDPEIRVTLVCLQDFQEVVRDSGGWDFLIPVRLEDTDALANKEVRDAFPHRPPFDSIPAFHREYDAVVTLNPDLGSAALCDRIQARQKFGRIRTYDGELRLLGPWAKYVFAMVAHRHENQFNLVDIHMGMAGVAPRPQAPSLPISPSRRDEARALLLACGWKGGRPLIALQTGSSDLHRAWELDRFAALATRLIEDGAEVVLLGDPREKQRAEEVARNSGRACVVVAGKGSLPLLPAVIAACDLLVSNDTGPIHVAAAVGTPTLGLYFATAWYSETAPYGEGHAVLQVEIPCAPCSAASRCAVQKCRDHLGVEDVLRTVRWLLHPGGAPPELPSTLGLYRSRFLANGTLHYAPVREGQLSEPFRKGLQGRLLWEAALGVGRDPEIESLWRRHGAGPDWPARKEDLETLFLTLQDSIERGAHLAGRLKEAFVGGHTGMVPILHAQLTRLGETLTETARESGLFGAYLRFEMMDLDFAEYPALATRLEEKYASMGVWIARLREALRDL